MQARSGAWLTSGSAGGVRYVCVGTAKIRGSRQDEEEDGGGDGVDWQVKEQRGTSCFNRY